MIVCIEGLPASGRNIQGHLLARRRDGARVLTFPDCDTQMGLILKGHLKRYWWAQRERAVCSEAGVSLDSGVLNSHVYQALQLGNFMEHAMSLEQISATEEHLVVSRYWPASWVFGTVDGLDPRWLERLHQHLPQPDLFLLLSIKDETSLRRRPAQNEGQDLHTMGRLYRTLWRDMAIREGQLRWKVVDGEGEVDEVEARVWAACEGTLG